MSELSSIQKTAQLNTRESLVRDMQALGLQEGMTVLVHASLSSMGWVCGGPVAVVQALMDVITPKGTLVMPTHSAELSDPSQWVNPPVPEAWWEAIRDSMPAFDPRITPTRGMGKIVEAFRTFPEVRRSNHPVASFAAWGKEAEFITTGQTLDFGFGEESPLAKTYSLGASVLLLGVNYDRNTSFHLAENRLDDREVVEEGAPVFENGVRAWKSYREIEMDSSRFAAIGQAFEETGWVNLGSIGMATGRLFMQKAAVDFALQWLANNPQVR